MRFISELAGELHDLIYKGKITTSTSTEYADLYKLGHMTKKKILLNVAVTDLQRYQHSSP